MKSARVSRREFLAAGVALSGAAVAAPGLLRARGANAAGEAAWPAASAWEELEGKVGGRLIEVPSPLAACRAGASAEACTAAVRRLDNPFYLQDQPGGTQTNGWLDAWTAELSPRAIAAESADDVAAGVDFAREHGVKLVVKGAGHDYKGRSNAPRSLLVWTHRMRDITFHESFRVEGAPGDEPGVPALSAAAGARWLDAYRVATANGRYVQGGGCTTVGVAGGFLQGGGFGSFSKRFGTGAGGALEFELVTADGKRRVANRLRHPDLFWALRGGGGGTFGIVTRATILAHPMPKTVGLVRGKITAASDDAFRALLGRFVAFYPDALNGPPWGEQISIGGDNTLGVLLTYLDLDTDAARRVWQPLLAFARATDGLEAKLTFDTYPFAGLWDPDFWEKQGPGMITRDDRPDAEPGTFWWTSNQGEVAEFLYTYQSRWIPLSLFEPAAAPRLVRALFDASRHANVRLQINKGLAGASREAVQRARQTSIHPGVFDAAMLAIIAERQQGAFPGVPGHEPDRAAARAAAEGANRAMQILRAATPGAGSYGNESDYFEKNWKQTYYGPPYQRLLEIKRKYDPGNLFRVHQGVGSDL
jgi:FAD/FMN-containing dehydrogenase